MSLHGQSVVVTGACGFIGSHLVEALVRISRILPGKVKPTYDRSKLTEPAELALADAIEKMPADTASRPMADVAELTDVHSADSIASVLARVLADPARLDGMRHAGPAQRRPSLRQRPS